MDNFLEMGHIFVNPPLSQAMSISCPKYVSISRATTCDIMCTTNTSATYTEIPMPRKLQKYVGIKATLPYSKPFSLSALVIPNDPTPAQRLHFRGLRQQLNEELKTERDQYFKQLEKEKMGKIILQDNCATMIQALYRGYKKRRVKPNKEYYTMRRYNRPYLTRNQIQHDLSLFSANYLKLKVIPGLTLPAPKGKKRKDTYEKFEVAAAIRLQCFFRMLTKRLKYLRHQDEKRRGKVFKALMILRKFFKFCYKIGQRERQLNIEKNRAVLLIQNFYRVYLSRSWYILTVILFSPTLFLIV